MPICLVGDVEDLASVYVAWQARRRGLPVLELPESAFGVDWWFVASDADDAGDLFVRGVGYPFVALLGAFVRLHPTPPLPPALDLEPAEAELYIRERRAAVRQLLQMLPCPVINRPGAGHANIAKPYQMRLLSRGGLEPPPWIASNDPAEVARFLATCPDGAIYKACSGLRSQVRRVDDELLSRLPMSTPVVVQAYIPGREVRVHVVGDRVFPTEVFAHEVDYRFEQGGGSYAPTSIPEDLARRCCAAAASEGLILAGLDFRVAPDGRWHCLEMNPVPSFLPYEVASGQPIASALLDIFAATGQLAV